MKLSVYAFGHQILRKKTEPVNEWNNELYKLIEDMWETMYHTRGIGLAAPQIGRSTRLFVVDTTQAEDEDQPSFKGIKKVFINPQIIEEKGEEWLYEEGCLSIPEIRGKVSRKPQLKIRYQDKDQNFLEEIYDDLNARVIQHEYDHLEGILFTDHLSHLKKQLIKGKLEKIRKGDISTKYKMVFAK